MRKTGVIAVILGATLFAGLSSADDYDACADQANIIDGVNVYAGVVCDMAAANAAQDAFTKATAAADAAKFPAPPSCDDSTVEVISTKIAGSTAWLKASKVSHIIVTRDDRLLSQLRADLAREKSNPSGVVDLQALHSTGAAIQYYVDERTKAAAEEKRTADRGQKIVAEVQKVIQSPACIARKKAIAAAKAAASAVPASSAGR